MRRGSEPQRWILVTSPAAPAVSADRDSERTAPIRRAPSLGSALSPPPAPPAPLTGRGLRQRDGHCQAREQRHAPPAPRPHRCRRPAGSGHGAGTARRLLCGVAGPGEPLGAGGRGGGGGWAEADDRARPERQQGAGGSAAAMIAVCARLGERGGRAPRDASPGAA